MIILLLLVPLSLVLLGAAIWAFVWAVRHGQFDDLDTPALDILAHDPHDPPIKPHEPAHPELVEGPLILSLSKDDHAD